MRGALGEAGGKPVFPEYHVRNRAIVGENREHRFRIASGGRRRVGNACPFVSQRFRFRTGAIVNGNFVTRAQQIADHSRTHFARANESYFHLSLSGLAECG